MADIGVKHLSCEVCEMRVGPNKPVYKTEIKLGNGKWIIMWLCSKCNQEMAKKD